MILRCIRMYCNLSQVSYDCKEYFLEFLLAKIIVVYAFSPEENQGRLEMVVRSDLEYEI